MPSPTTARCQHLHPNGNSCHSFALRDQQFCYHHHPSRPPAHRSATPRRDRTLHPPGAHQSPAPSRSPLPEVALHIADNTLDTKRAGLLLQLPANRRRDPFDLTESKPESIRILIRI